MGGAGSNELQTAQRRPQLRKHQRSQLVVDQVLVGSATGAAPAVVAVWICHASEVRRELGTNLSLRDSVVLQHVNKDMGSNVTISVHHPGQQAMLAYNVPSGTDGARRTPSVHGRSQACLQQPNNGQRQDTTRGTHPPNMASMQRPVH